MIEPTTPPACLARGDCECLVSLSDLAKELQHSEPYTGDIWVEIDGSTGLSAPIERINEGDMLETGVSINVACGKCSCDNGVMKCSKSNCTDDCQWSQWQEWSSCSASCGTGVRFRNRTIASPARFGGERCQSQGFQEFELCNTNTCPCVWSQWSQWSDCSATCNGGLKTRTRTPQGECTTDESSRETALCNVQPCGATPTTPGTCAGGKTLQPCSDVSCPHTCAQLANESCTEALDCTSGCFCPRGSVFDEKVQVCVLPSQCTCDLASLSCGTCSQAACVNGVAKCEPTVNCDCSWDTWDEWSPCSKACGGGNRTRTRSHATKRRGSGRSCSGPAQESETCNAGRCPGCTDRFGNVVEPGATMQSEDACEICYCSYFTHARVCQPKSDADATKPQPAWSPWSQFSACSAACGTGNRHRTRVCLHACLNDTRTCATDPSTGLRETDRQVCNQQDCRPPVDCRVGNWRNGTCLAECDGTQPTVPGMMPQMREVVQAPANGGAACQQLYREVACTAQCNVDCVTGDWAPWSECAKSCQAGAACNPSCGVGVRERVRPVLRQAANGGRACRAKEYQPCGMPCNETTCAGPESVVPCATKCWRSCDDVREDRQCPGGAECRYGCGCPGTKVREGDACVEVAQCGCKDPSNPSVVLPPGSTVNKDCNKCTCTNGRMVCEEKSCAQDCVYSPWEKVGGCNVTCGSGKQTWRRAVATPASGGGAECSGPTERVTDCFGDEGACCSPNDAYVESGRCEPTCEQLLRPELQQPGGSCTAGCQCKPGMVRRNGTCVSVDDCFACTIGGVVWPNGREQLDRANCSKRYCAQGRLVTEPLTPEEVPACTQADEVLASLQGSVKTLDSGGCCYRASLRACARGTTLLRDAKMPNGTLCKFVQPVKVDRCTGACPGSNTVHVTEQGKVKVMGECSCCTPVGYRSLPPEDVACISGGKISISLFSIEGCACSSEKAPPIGLSP